ncbi:hypothetical protein DOM22_14695 [Bdellovibrio sp. ZAP7]|uniref:hypothetical protein n=1 Tax=Bdellovibrio sp. ZAP7 TaxID=2231053 RepID=UPI001158F61B|nr:hypothetical protein [Bdellovibrio sp. ZAP7]QDK46325.1 hypothetical protein DOM22_14695 [Bdellovibrio sp. ZAP7]
MKSKTLRHLFLSFLLLTAASSVGCSGNNAADEDKPKLYMVGEELHLTRAEAYAAISMDLLSTRGFHGMAFLRGSLHNVQFLEPKVQEVELRGASWYEINTTMPGCPASSAGFGNLGSDNTYDISIRFDGKPGTNESCRYVIDAFVSPVRIKIGPTPVTLTDGRKAVADSVILYINYRDSDLN